MKRKRILLISLVLGGVGGWLLGYLRLPLISEDHSFWLGFFAGLVLLFILLSFYFIASKQTYLFESVSDDSDNTKDQGIWKNYKRSGVLAATFIIMCSLLSSILFFNQNKNLKAQLTELNVIIEQQSEMMQANRKEDQVGLMANVLDKVDEEIATIPGGPLSPSTISRIEALSYSFKPYRYLENDTLSAYQYSPERSQLLMALLNMDIDSSSFNKIKFKTSFSYADFRSVKLDRANLSIADLIGADFREATLRYAILNDADLRDARFWGADMNEADLYRANLRRADFSWANLNEANLSYADMSGIKLKATKLKKANLIKILCRWSLLEGALLNEANLVEADFTGSVFVNVNFQKAKLVRANLRYMSLTQTDFSGANLKDADLKFTDLSAVNFSGANLEGVIIDDKDWFSTLKKAGTIGIEEIIKKYKIVETTPGKSIYRLERIEGE